MKRILLTAVIVFISFCTYAQKPSASLLTPANHTLVLVDYEGQMAFPTKSIDIGALRANVALVAGASMIFSVPTIVTTIDGKKFSGPVFPEILEIYPDTAAYIDRTNMNAWEDRAFHQSVVGKAKKKIVFGGLWTEVCIAYPVLSAIAEGYDVYVLTDASGGVSLEAHQMSIHRMIQAGAHPVTSAQYVLELQRDWARKDTYDAVLGLFKKYGGAYGLGIQYAAEMLPH